MRRRTLLLLAAAAFLHALPVEGQEAPAGGVIQGAVRHIDTGQPVPGVRITVVGTEPERSVETGADGSYRLEDVPAGPHLLEVRREGLVSQSVEVVVLARRARTLDFSLIPMEEETVRGVKRRDSAALQMQQRQQAAQAGETVNKQDMKVGTGSDVGQVVARAPGVNLQGGKYAYVRGLGDRYSQTLVNGAQIPSPEPDKRVIPLDLFPTNLVESVSITKTYSPDLPGEFAGGSVQIKTIDVPTAPFLNLGVGLRAREGTTLRDFKTYHGGNLDLLTFDDGTRDLPDEVPGQKVVSGTPPTGFTDAELQEIGRSFSNIWEPDVTTAPPDLKLNLSFGRTFGDVGSGRLGVVGALNWGNKYQNIDDETRRILLNFGTVEEPQPGVFNDFQLDSSTFESELSAVFNLTYQFSEAQKLGVRNLWTRSAEDEVRVQTGVDGQVEQPVEITRLRWVERSLFVTQPYGEHLLLGDTFLEWRAGYALSQRDEPDNRQVRYVFNESLNTFRFDNIPGSGRRDYFILDENIYDLGLDYSIPFNVLGIDDDSKPDQLIPTQRIKVGAAYVFRDRSLDARRFRFSPSGQPFDENGNPIDLTSSPEDLLEEKNINPDGFILEESTRVTDEYTAEQTLQAAYGLVDFRLHRTVRLQAGARLEDSVQELNSFTEVAGEKVPVETDLKTFDILPSANLIWEFWKEEGMQVRVGGSQTVSRPEFRELAEFEYTDVEGGFTARGNPNLKRAKILNLDLRLEWYPKPAIPRPVELVAGAPAESAAQAAAPFQWAAPGDLISAGVFYKDFQDPIEQVILPTSSQFLTTWDNAEKAELFGFEIELRKSLVFLDDLFGLGQSTPGLVGAGPGAPPPPETFSFREVGLIFNLAIVESEVEITAEDSTVQTNDTRPLQGQAEYLFNAGIVYESRALDLTFAILASTVGERISAVGAFGVPDEKEQPRWTLDVSLEKRFGKSALKITGENLLDDNYLFQQGDFTTREYTVGFAIGISYSYSF